ncbi:hypothetical protein [Ochrobactrum sp. A-1]|uniref:hypothetical protein n=1 Tax=Ochrobactrum sp. A-1 TaxID=2920940 RepID=UPI001F0B0D19|nr:hypothetical protein [Ochrobactrum sp. A-1]
MKNVAILTVALLSLSTTAQAGDLSGHYASSGTCSNSEKTQCWIEVKDKKNALEIRHVVADRMNANKILCSTKIIAKKEDTSTAVEQQYSGRIGKDGVYVRHWPQLAQINLYEGRLNKKVCKKYSYMYEYGMIGD